MNTYLPLRMKINQIKSYTPLIKFYRLEFLNINDKEKFSFIPGQFVIISVLGYGEAPFGIVSYTTEFVDIVVRKVGDVTKAMDKLKINEEIGLRGPFGNGFPIEKMQNKEIILVAGGTGIAPIACLIDYLIQNRKNFKQIFLLYGAKTPSDLLFQERYKIWEKNINLCLTVDQPTPEWQKNIGLVTTLCANLKSVIQDPSSTLVIMCGPPPMYQPMYQELKNLGINDQNIFVSMERRMKCGIGKCQHCTIGRYYTCLDGPVFEWEKVSHEL